MSKISLASRLAIAFIRPFRSYLDGYNLIKESKPEFEKDLEERINKLAVDAKKFNPTIDENRINYAKECMFIMNTQYFSNYNKSYEKVLPDVINELTISLEKELNKSFTDEEIRSLVEIINNPVINKLIYNKEIFGLLKKYELDMDYKLRMQNLESSMSSNNLEKMKDMFSKIKKKWGIKDSTGYDDNDEDSDSGWKENDEYNP